jgi:hypothetical protein
MSAQRAACTFHCAHPLQPLTQFLALFFNASIFSLFGSQLVFEVFLFSCQFLSERNLRL